MYYSSRESKDTDQLCSYCNCTADLRLWFRISRLLLFSHAAAHLLLYSRRRSVVLVVVCCTRIGSHLLSSSAEYIYMACRGKHRFATFYAILIIVAKMISFTSSREK